MHEALLTLLVGFVAVSSLAREALAQPLRTVAVIDAVKFPPKTKQAHEHLRAALEEALSPKSWFLAQTQPIVDCGGTVECLAKVADNTATKYVLRMSGSRTPDDGYDVTLELYQSATSRIQRSGAYCDYCDLQRITEVVSHSVVELLANGLKEEADIRAAKKPSEQPPTVPPASPAPSANIIVPPVTSAPRSVSWMPWALMGTGLLAMGYGGWALYEDGKSSGSCSTGRMGTSCEQNSSTTRGALSLIGGGLAGIGGLTWAIITRTHSAAVSASPNHITLNVRF